MALSPRSPDSVYRDLSGFIGILAAPSCNFSGRNLLTGFGFCGHNYLAASNSDQHSADDFKSTRRIARAKPKGGSADSRDHFLRCRRIILHGNGAIVRRDRRNCRRSDGLGVPVFSCVDQNFTQDSVTPQPVRVQLRYISGCHEL